MNPGMEGTSHAHPGRPPRLPGGAVDRGVGPFAQGAIPLRRARRERRVDGRDVRRREGGGGDRPGPAVQPRDRRAVQTAFLYARDRGYDAVVRIDGDGQHEVEDIPRCWSRSWRGGRRRSSAPGSSGRRNIE